MANGRFILGKQSGGTLGLVFPDGIEHTEVVLPESGDLVTKEYVDTGAGAAFVTNDNRVKKALIATGTAPIYACRAWVNFNGTGTVAIRENGNVSSIIDNGVGHYRVNFTTAMPDTDYAVIGTAGDNINNYVAIVSFGSRSNLWVPTTTSIRFQTVFDVSHVNMAIFR